MIDAYSFLTFFTKIIGMFVLNLFFLEVIIADGFFSIAFLINLLPSVLEPSIAKNK